MSARMFYTRLPGRGAFLRRHPTIGVLGRATKLPRQARRPPEPLSGAIVSAASWLRGNGELRFPSCAPGQALLNRPVLVFFQTGAQVNAVAPAATAFVHRDSDWLIAIALNWGAHDSRSAILNGRRVSMRRCVISAVSLLGSRPLVSHVAAQDSSQRICPLRIDLRRGQSAAGFPFPAKHPAHQRDGARELEPPRGAICVCASRRFKGRRFRWNCNGETGSAEIGMPR